MILETVEAEGLSHLSYVLGDEQAGVCAVIDPRRDADVYLEIARRYSARITYILETHIHADFVSGSRELSAQTGAPICVGASDEYGFEHRALREGKTLELGRLSLKVLHTPGHTPEHVAFLVSGGKGAQAPWGLFTGDTLFSGEVGRPDLLGDGSEERLARSLFHTLRGKLLALEDGVEVYPAHGEGSPCGGSIGDRRSSTIGYERLHNPKLRIEREEPFVRAVLGTLPPAPFYYRRMKKVNVQGPRLLRCIAPLPPLEPERFQTEMQEKDTIVVDTREIEGFGGAHIAGALSIALRAQFPQWAGWMLRPEQRLLLVLGDDRDAERVQRHLLRVGYENLTGYLRQGMRGWLEAGLPFTQTGQMSVHELHARVRGGKGDLQVLDVRRDDEWEQGHIPTARHIFAPYLSEHLETLDRERPVAVYCGSGYRASIAASVLQREGFARVYNVPGSMRAWEAAGYEKVRS